MDQLTLRGSSDGVISHNDYNHLQGEQQHLQIHGHHYQQHDVMHHHHHVQQQSYAGDVVPSLTSLKDGSIGPEVTGMTTEGLEDLIESGGLDSTTTGLLLGVLTGGHHHQNVIISCDSRGGVTASTINDLHELPSPATAVIGHNQDHGEGNLPLILQQQHQFLPTAQDYHHHQLHCHPMAMTTASSPSSFKNNMEGTGSSISSSPSTTISSDQGMYFIVPSFLSL